MQQTTINGSISAKDLHENLKNVIKTSGILNDVKASIRKDIILQLISKQRPQHQSKLDFRSRIAQSVVYQYLRANDLLKTLSVFEAESGVESNSILSEDELNDALRLQKLSINSETFNSNSTLDKLVRVFQADGVENLFQTSYRKEKDFSLSTIHADTLSGIPTRKEKSRREETNDQTGTLKSEAQLDRSRSAALAFKCEELQNLVEDQQKTIASLLNESGKSQQKPFSMRILESHGHLSVGRSWKSSDSTRTSFRDSIPRTADRNELLVRHRAQDKSQVSSLHPVYTVGDRLSTNFTFQQQHENIEPKSHRSTLPRDDNSYSTEAMLHKYEFNSDTQDIPIRGVDIGSAEGAVEVVHMNRISQSPKNAEVISRTSPRIEEDAASLKARAKLISERLNRREPDEVSSGQADDVVW